MSQLGQRTCTREANIIPLIREGKGFQPDNCTASVEEEFNRLKDCSKLERLIERIWECTREKKPCLVNRIKFRLHGVDVVKEGDEVPPEEGEGEGEGEGEEEAPAEGEEEAPAEGEEPPPEEPPPEEEAPAEGEEAEGEGAGEEGEAEKEAPPEGEQEEVCRTISVSTAKICLRGPEVVEDVEAISCHFKLGLTWCKEYIGTNCLPYQHDVQQLLILGCNNYCNRGAYFSHPLGVGAMVATNDEPPRYVFLRRINECCESRRLIDRAGTLPDPEKIPLPSGEYDLAKATPEDLVKEIFDSATRAVVEEIGVPADTLTDVELLGIVINLTKGERPTAEFHMNCTLPMEKVLYNYNKCRHSGRDRSLGILFTTAKEIRETPLPQSMFFKGLAPCSKGAVLLIRKQMQSQKAFDKKQNREKKPPEGGEGEGGEGEGEEGGEEEEPPPEE